MYMQLALRSRVPYLKSMLRVRARGPLKLLGGHLQLPIHLKCCNPEHYICTIDEGSSLCLDLLVEWGRGLWLADLKGKLAKHNTKP